MSNQLVPMSPAMQQAQMPALIQNQLQAMGYNVQDSALSQGVGVQFANVSYKGKVFRIKYGANETLLVDPQTNQPLQYLDVILVDAKKELSKTYYASGYVEGSSEAPDCSSEDGVHPVAPAGKQPQAVDCRTCPWNAFGSKKSSDGVATNSKACADTRKVVVVPPVNIQNERFGGPMLLRIPAASLQGLAQFDRTLSAQGIPFFAVIVRITFDYTVSYPKLQFQAMQYLSDQQFAEVVAMRADPRTRDILNQGSQAAPQNVAAPTPAPAPAPIQGQPPVGMATQAPPPSPAEPPPAQQPAQAWGTAPATAPAPAPAAPPPVTAAWGAPPPVQAQPVAQAAAPIPQQPAQAPQQTSFAPPPVAAPPVQQPMAYAPPQAAAPAPQTQAAPSALPQEVLNSVDAMFGN
jgi:hypothetical protein